VKARYVGGDSFVILLFRKQVTGGRIGRKLRHANDNGQSVKTDGKCSVHAPVWVCICMYSYIHTQPVSVFVYMYIYICIYTHTVSAYICMCGCICMYIYMYIYKIPRYPSNIIMIDTK